MKKVMILAISILFLMSCEPSTKKTPQASSGVKKATAKVVVGSNGLTTEQNNIKKRYKVDNEIGSIKHLYVISAYSGEVILYSTVDGKVTSGGKRLTSSKILETSGSESRKTAMPNIQDDGTYGSSMNYLYWFDVKGIYHQHYIGGGQIVHISTQALPVKSITINLSK